MQSGKPVGVFRTTQDAPRVLIANANLVPHWATWEQFRELERAGLTMVAASTGAAVPIQLLAERLARARGTNPDTIGREDPRQAAAAEA